MSASFEYRLKKIKETVCSPKAEIKSINQAVVELAASLSANKRPVDAILESGVVPKIMEITATRRATVSLLMSTFFMIGNLVKDDEKTLRYHLKHKIHIYIIEFIHEDASLTVLEYALQALANIMYASSQARDDIIKVKGLHRIMKVFEAHKGIKELKSPLSQVMNSLTNLSPYPNYNSLKAIFPYLRYVFVETEDCTDTISHLQASLHTIRNLVKISPLRSGKDLHELGILSAIQVNFVDEKRLSITAIDPYLNLFEYIVLHAKESPEYIKLLLGKEVFARLIDLLDAKTNINKRAICVVFNVIIEKNNEHGLTCARELLNNRTALESFKNIMKFGHGRAPDEAVKTLIIILLMNQDELDEILYKKNIIAASFESYENIYHHLITEFINVLLQKNKKKAEYAKELLDQLKTTLASNNNHILDELLLKKDCTLKATVREAAQMLGLASGSRRKRSMQPSKKLLNGSSRSRSKSRAASKSENKARTPRKASTVSTRRNGKASSSTASESSERSKAKTRKQSNRYSENKGQPAANRSSKRRSGQVYKNSTTSQKSQVSTASRHRESDSDRKNSTLGKSLSYSSVRSRSASKR